MEQKKYKVLKELRFNNGFWTINGIFEECDLQPFDVNALVNQGCIEEVEEDKPMEQKKYKAIADYNFCGISVDKGLIFNQELDGRYECQFHGGKLIFGKSTVESSTTVFEEVKEDTLKESILYKYINTDCYGKIINEITDWHNKEVIKQKIELLKEVLSHKCSFENIGGQWIGKVVIDDKISELQKEIK